MHFWTRINASGFGSKGQSSRSLWGPTWKCSPWHC